MRVEGGDGVGSEDGILIVSLGGTVFCKGREVLEVRGGVFVRKEGL